MNLNPIAQRILAAVQSIDPETRYEEKSWNGPNGPVEGTNPALRSSFGAACGETGYPTGGECCDLVIPTESGLIWIESKHAWTWHTYKNPAGPNKVYRKHLLGESGNSALNDARVKLPRLVGHPDVAAVGMLVIVLDSDELPHSPSDIAAFENASGLNAAPWKRFGLPRWRSRVPGYPTIGITPYLWLRPAHPQAVVNV